jgi:hypothetical protein
MPVYIVISAKQLRQYGPLFLRPPIYVVDQLSAMHLYRCLQQMNISGTELCL